MNIEYKNETKDSFIATNGNKKFTCSPIAQDDTAFREQRKQGYFYYGILTDGGLGKSGFKFFTSLDDMQKNFSDFFSLTMEKTRELLETKKVSLLEKSAKLVKKRKGRPTAALIELFKAHPNQPLTSEQIKQALPQLNDDQIKQACFGLRVKKFLAPFEKKNLYVHINSSKPVSNTAIPKKKKYEYKYELVKDFFYKHPNQEFSLAKLVTELEKLGITGGARFAAYLKEKKFLIGKRGYYIYKRYDKPIQAVKTEKAVKTQKNSNIDDILIKILDSQISTLNAVKEMLNVRQKTN